MRIRKGDNVFVVKGKNRGQKGTIVHVLPGAGRVLIDGLNKKVRHTRPRRAGEKGQRVEVIHPVSVANVRIICPACSKATRVGYNIADGHKVRICKLCKASLQR